MLLSNLSLAVEHTKLVRELAEKYSKSHGTNFRYEYSPETFSQTETAYAVEVCEAVKKTWLGGSESVWADGRKEERIIFVSALTQPRTLQSNSRTSPPQSKSRHPTATLTKSSSSARASPSAKSASSPSIPTTTAAAPSPLLSSVSLPVPTVLRAQSSVTVNARAMSTWSL